MRALQRIRLAIREQRYRISLHANEEMSKDKLVLEDVENILLTGKIKRRFTHDPRGIRYEIVGSTIANRHACIVCRFLPSEILLIITVYCAEEL